MNIYRVSLWYAYVIVEIPEEVENLQRGDQKQGITSQSLCDIKEYLCPMS